MIRALFVDDEPIVLRALDRGLRTSTRWQTGFVSSGADALDLLGREPFDVIVSDIGMPMMDGLTLLGHVQARHPHMARLVLSGELAQIDDVRGAVVAHQWLAKPCSLSRLRATIELLLGTRALIADRHLVGAVTGLGHLPSAPALCTAVSEVLAQAGPMTELVALLEQDPAIAGKLLQLVNSAFYGLGQRVTSVQRAASVLGAECLTRLLRAPEVFRPSAAAGALVAGSQLVAQLAGELAPRERADDAFLAGLLHGVGTLAIAGMATPPQLSPTLHARLGGMLLGTWGLPADIVAAVAFHRDPDAAPDPREPTLRLVALAAALAVELATGERGHATDTGAAALALDPARCRELAMRVRER